MAVWQLRVAILERRDRRSASILAGPLESSVEGALPVVAPLGRLPADVLGREELAAEPTRR